MPKPAGNRKKLKGASVKSSTARPKAKGSSKSTARPSLSAGQLFERAQQALAFERYDAALECMRDALQLEPENTDIIDAHGALLAELGRVDEAVQVRQGKWHAFWANSWHAYHMKHRGAKTLMLLSFSILTCLA
jgi:Flp pilus assembly protein TadD